MKALNRLFIAWLMSAAVPASVLAAQTQGYRVTRHISVGGDGFWDYLTVDAASRRLYVAHGTRVQVLDIDADTLVGEIPNTRGVHGVALAPDLGRGFTSNGTLPIGAGVDATAFDPETQLAFSANGEGTVTVIAEETPDRYRVVANVATQRGARTLALDGRTHRLFTATGQFTPAPPATEMNPRPRPGIVPGSFVVLLLSP
jgi:DNA-binding beta-propeller fold protein YncE